MKLTNEQKQAIVDQCLSLATSERATAECFELKKDYKKACVFYSRSSFWLVQVDSIYEAQYLADLDKAVQFEAKKLPKLAA